MIFGRSIGRIFCQLNCHPGDLCVTSVSAIVTEAVGYFVHDDIGTRKQTFVDFIWMVLLLAGFGLGGREPGRSGRIKKLKAIKVCCRVPWPPYSV